LAVHVTPTVVRRIDCRDVTVNAFLGNELEAGPAKPLPAPAWRAH